MDRIEMRIYGGRAAVLSLGVNQNSTLSNRSSLLVALLKNALRSQIA